MLLAAMADALTCKLDAVLCLPRHGEIMHNPCNVVSVEFSEIVGY